MTKAKFKQNAGSGGNGKKWKKNNQEDKFRPLGNNFVAGPGMF